MKLPHSQATNAIHSVIRHRGETYSVTRQTGTENIGMGETRQTTTTVSTDALLYSPSESNEMFQFGDRLTGDLNGLVKPTADVQVGDEFDHGGDTYEVTEIDSRPSGTDSQVKRFALDRVTGER